MERQQVARALERIGEHARSELESLHGAREDAYVASRRVIRAAANAIRAIHRDDVEQAVALLDEASQALEVIRAARTERAELVGAGFVLDAQKEYAEAHITVGLLTDKEILGPDELHVEVAAWLNGLAEVVGELRRRLLDQLRAGQHEDAEDVLALMEDILALLTTIDYPDGVTAGLRRSTDIARSITERSRGDLTNALAMARLHRALEAHRAEFT